MWFSQSYLQLEHRVTETSFGPEGGTVGLEPEKAQSLCYQLHFISTKNLRSYI